MTETEQLEQAIAALEAQRAILGDAVVNTALAPMREKLAALKAAHPPADAQRKLATILFADVSGFTALSETRDAEEVTELLNALWRRLDQAITSHGGLIDKHIGDSVMALWGVEHAREDDPERAIRAALAMQALLNDERGMMNDDQRRVAGSSSFIAHPSSLLHLRIGLNTGPVLLGQVGTTREFTAMGDAVNLASRLEHAAPVDGILISHEVYRHVRGVFDVQALDPIPVKGKAEPVQVYVVQGAKPRAFHRPTRGVEGVETPMVGRETEFKALQHALETVAEDGELQVVTVVGEAGVGKSRLLSEFEHWLDVGSRQAWYFKGRVDAGMTAVPFALIRDVFAYRFGIQDSDPLETARHKLEHGVTGFMAGDSDAVEKAHFIGHLLGFDFSASPHLTPVLADPNQIRQRAFYYLTQFFRAVTQGRTTADGGRKTGDDASSPRPPSSILGPPSAVGTRPSSILGPPSSVGTPPSSVLGPSSSVGFPAVILLEDIHWADDASLDLLDHLARELGPSESSLRRRPSLPLLIVALTRPTLFERRPLWGEGESFHTRLTLRPLDRRDSRRLVDEILRKAKYVPPELRDTIVAGAEGNPFYLEELIKMLVEAGVIVTRVEPWRVDLDRLNAVRVPPTLVGVLQARLDALAPAERETLKRASVVGQVFWDA
ncbi:MAG: AAA family ATPase, partial [Anaerolineae bacterium]|nr:AAA family ATPase [Anaerolineae bacterium]